MKYDEVKAWSLIWRCLMVTVLGAATVRNKVGEGRETHCPIRN